MHLSMQRQAILWFKKHKLNGRDLATALLELFEADNAIEIIGTRHGEKKAETLLTRRIRTM